MDGSDQVDTVFNVKSYGIAVDYLGNVAYEQLLFISSYIEKQCLNETVFKWIKPGRNTSSKRLKSGPLFLFEFLMTYQVLSAGEVRGKIRF